MHVCMLKIIVRHTPGGQRQLQQELRSIVQKSNSRQLSALALMFNQATVRTCLTAKSTAAFAKQTARRLAVHTHPCDHGAAACDTSPTN